MRICTYNIHAGTDAERRPSLPQIAETLRSVDPDVCLLQEVDRFLPRSHFEDQARTLAVGLDATPYFYGRLRFGRIAFGNAILLRNGVERGAKVHRLSLPASGGEPRCALGVSLAQGIVVWNTHLGLRDDWRETQLGALADALPGASTNRGVVVGGDFNCSWESPEMLAFRARGKLEALTGDEPTFPVPQPSHRIDFLLGRGVVSVAYGLREDPGSDHCLLWCDLEREERGQG